MGNDILKMYDLVFKDMVECYIEGMEEEDIVELTEEEKNRIVDRLIYKSEYMWEIINDTIDNEIGKILLDR